MIHIGNAPIVDSLAAHAVRWQTTQLREVIDRQATQRAEFVVRAAGLALDYSRQRLDQAVLDDLLRLAEQCDLPGARQAMLQGQEINASEGRAVLHTALRAAQPPAAVADVVLSERARQAQFVSAVLDGKIGNAAGESFTDVLNIGIGGSDLGPRLVTEALQRPGVGLRAHFVGNLDSAALDQILAQIDPRRCLCLVVSKSFRTQETRRCAERVQAWLQAHGGDTAAQFVAVTAAPDKAQAFGIAPERLFPMWSWVGGRFSLWSSVGLSAALALGWPAFAELLAGAQEMDEHFAQAPLAENLPVIWALIALWNRNFLDYESTVTAPYSDMLARLPNWLQQLDMESNGKSIGRDGAPLAHACAPVQWGGVGTNAQHAFFQLLHQGREGHPVDFVLPLQVPGADRSLQQQLLGNALAQSAALSHGRGAAELGDFSAEHAAWRTCPGNRPSSLLWLEQLSPRVVGALLAAYEHRCFVQGWLWGLNSFDQFGVELGKDMAAGIEAGLAGDDSAWPDALLRAQAQRLQTI